MKTKPDGVFCVKFELNENDILILEEIGYDPTVFKIYEYLRDADLL
jgi:hypothetical protein